MDFVKEIEINLNKEAEKEYVGNTLTNIRFSGADTTKLMEDISYVPETNIRFGVKKFIDWYLKYNLKNLWKTN